MIEFVNENNISEYESYVAQHSRCSYLQSYYWSRVNPDWRWRGLICRNRYKRIIGTLSYMVREVPLLPYQVIYCCRGPVTAKDDEDAVYELLGGLREAAREERACLVQLDVPYSDEAKSVRHILSLRHYRVKKHRHTHPKYPKRSWVISLRGGWQEVQSRFTDEHSQYIQLAARHGVDVRWGGKNLIAVFADLMEKKALQEEQLGYDASYYASLAEAFGDDIRCYAAYVNYRPVAAAMVLRYGTTAYCIGEADFSNPAMHAMHLLRATMLMDCCNRGCTVCEFPGLTGSKETAAYDFEEGFGGRPMVYMGEADWLRLPISGLLARLILKISDAIKLRKYLIHIR